VRLALGPKDHSLVLVFVATKVLRLGQYALVILWIYGLPNWLLLILVLAVTLTLCWAAVFLLRPVMVRLFGSPDERNTLIELVLTATGLFYGLLLGLIAAATYTTFSEAQTAADTEAGTISSLYRDVSAYPEPARTRLRTELEDYVDYVINDAWPQQQHGIVPSVGADRATGILNTLAQFEPATAGQQAIHTETFSQFNKFLDARRARLNAVTAGLPASLWWVLIIGAVVNLVLMSMLAVDRILAHVLLSGLFAIFVGMMIFLIIAMDNPFLGPYSISPAAFESLREQVLRH
jgi:hypothetical protein